MIDAGFEKAKKDIESFEASEYALEEAFSFVILYVLSTTPSGAWTGDDTTVPVMQDPVRSDTDRFEGMYSWF